MPMLKKSFNIPERKRLRILLDPIYVQVANLTSSSTYHKYVALTKELVSRGNFVYWMVPDVEYIPKSIEDHPNVGIIRSSYIQDQFVVDGLFTDRFFNLFNRIAGEYHIDVLCTSRNSLVAYYKRVLDPPRFHDTGGNFTDKGYGLPIVLIEEFPQTRERQHSGRAYWINQIMGYLCSDRVIFLSDHNRKEVIQEMMDFVTIRETSKFTSNIRVIPSGIETAELDKIYEPDRWRVETGFNVISVGRLFGVSYIEYLPWFDVLFKAGYSDASFTVSLSGALSGPMRAKLTKIGFDLGNFGKQFKLYENNPRSNFLRMLRKLQVAVVPVSHLDHPTGVFEALYLGVPCILPLSDFQQTFFKDYPYVIDPKDKAAYLATLLHIRDNLEEARELILPWRQVIKNLYDSPTNIKLLSDQIEITAREYISRFRTSKGVVDLCKTLKGESYTWEDVVAYLSNAGRMGVSIGDMGIRTTFTYSRGAINHAMHMSNFEDLCDSPREKFVRKDLVEAHLAENRKTNSKALLSVPENQTPRQISKVRSLPGRITAAVSGVSESISLDTPEIPRREKIGTGAGKKISSKPEG